MNQFFRMVFIWLVAVEAFGSDLTVSLHPKRLLTGQTGILRVSVAPTEKIAADLKAKMGETEIPLFACPTPSENSRCGFVPIEVESSSGTRNVVVQWAEGEKPQSKTLSFSVGLAKYSESKLKVDPDRVKPTPEQQVSIDAEIKETAAAYAAAIATPQWQETIRPPLKGAVTSRFGNRRSFNGVTKSIHRGVDLRAAAHTPIKSALSGKVVLAKELFYAGNFVLIDHGAGLFSSYCHMSALKVTAGQSVKAGDVVGLSGATGRVTGPHLHWGIRVNGVSVDPMQMTKVFGELPLMERAG